MTRPPASSLLTILDLVESDLLGESPARARLRGIAHQDADELAVQESVRVDLERLLNARRPPWPIPARLDAVQVAVRAHGMPDVGPIALSQRSGQREFQTEMERTIRDADRRLKDVRVQEDRRRSHDRTQSGREEGVMSVQIIADLEFGTDGPPVRYQTRLLDVAGRFDVTRGRG